MQTFFAFSFFPFSFFLFWFFFLGSLLLFPLWGCSPRAGSILLVRPPSFVPHGAGRKVFHLLRFPVRCQQIQNANPQCC
uniref:Uncharacterized protein n=1 Tax=Sus scrofa TaxID=9823 RepID=A0A8D2CG78_PIG